MNNRNHNVWPFLPCQITTFISGSFELEEIWHSVFRRFRIPQLGHEKECATSDWMDSKISFFLPPKDALHNQHHGSFTTTIRRSKRHEKSAARSGFWRKKNVQDWVPCSVPLILKFKESLENRSWRIGLTIPLSHKCESETTDSKQNSSFCWFGSADFQFRILEDCTILPKAETDIMHSNREHSIESS